MAYSKIRSQQSLLELRFQKLNQQRFVIAEKNESKKKLSGNTLTLSEHNYLLPKPILSLPSSSIVDHSHSRMMSSSPGIISAAQHVQPTQLIFSDNIFNPDRDPNLIDRHISSPCETSELLEDLPIHHKESSLEFDYDNPCRFFINDNLSNINESEMVDAHKTSSKSSENPCPEYLPALCLLPTSSLSTFPIENDIPNFVLTPIIRDQVFLFYFLK